VQGHTRQDVGKVVDADRQEGIFHDSFAYVGHLGLGLPSHGLRKGVCHEAVASPGRLGLGKVVVFSEGDVDDTDGHSFTEDVAEVP
jgi:transketolase